MGIYTKEEQFKLIEENPLNLKEIDNQYENICLDAVRRNEYAFEYVLPKLIPYVSFNIFLECYNLLFLKGIEEGLQQFIGSKNKIEDNIFLIDIFNYRSRDNNYRFLNVESLLHVKDFLLKENCNNTYISDSKNTSDWYLDLLKELALSNNNLVIIDNGNIKPIHKKLANKIITKEDLEKGFF